MHFLKCQITSIISELLMKAGLLFVAVSLVLTSKATPCHFSIDNPVEFFLDDSHRPEHKYRDISALPTAVDWRFKDGQRYTTWSRNQRTLSILCTVYPSFHLRFSFDINSADQLELQTFQTIVEVAGLLPLPRLCPIGS